MLVTRKSANVGAAQRKLLSCQVSSAVPLFSVIKSTCASLYGCVYHIGFSYGTSELRKGKDGNRLKHSLALYTLFFITL